jgi:hypothetical protein
LYSRIFAHAPPHEGWCSSVCGSSLLTRGFAEPHQVENTFGVWVGRAAQLVVVQNRLEELKRLVPAK